MSGDSDDAVWADPEEIFAAVGSIRQHDAFTATISLTPPATGGLMADMMLSSVASRCASLPSDLAANLEVIAKAFTVGAIDAYRADGGDD